MLEYSFLLYNGYYYDIGRILSYNDELKLLDKSQLGLTKLYHYYHNYYRPAGIRTYQTSEIKEKGDMHFHSVIY